jgi:serine protease AprX
MLNYFVRLPDSGSVPQVMGLMRPLEPTAQAKRAGARPKPPRQSKVQPTLLVGALDTAEARALERSGAQIYDDSEFEPFPGSSAREFWNSAPDPTAPAATLSLDDVLRHIRAPDAWSRSRGAGVTVAIVDTGICGQLLEFPAAKRSSIDLPTAFAGQHWEDTDGHGSMCATIAAATKADNGRFDGVAPDATVLSARTTLMATDIYDIYDELITLKLNGTIGSLVISDSYGLYTCERSGMPQDHPYLEIVLSAISNGIPVVFAAGNNHYDVACNHDPTECSPNTIWAVNSHDQVISVGTVNADNSNRDPATPHVNSSRGPGEWAVSLPKPDCVAPTYGEVVWGCDYRVMDWWGTSGACPQVAGLAALILSVNPLLGAAQIADIIRNSCRDIGAPSPCVGRGLIDCASAVEAAAAVV